MEARRETARPTKVKLTIPRDQARMHIGLLHPDSIQRVQNVVERITKQQIVRTSMGIAKYVVNMGTEHQIVNPRRHENNARPKVVVRDRQFKP